MHCNTRSTGRGKNSYSLRRLKSTKVEKSCCSTCKSAPSSAATQLVFKTEEKTELFAEKIIFHQVTRHGLKYLVKWKGYPDSYNTWEPEESLKCPGLIVQYEKNLDGVSKVKRRSPRPYLQSTTPEAISQKESSVVETESNKVHEESDLMDEEFDIVQKESSKAQDVFSMEQREPDKIIGVAEINGKFCFLMRWNQDDLNADFIPVAEAKIKWPQVVIQFYEKWFKRIGGATLREILEVDQLNDSN